jgi:hypothetical protein
VSDYDGVSIQQGPELDAGDVLHITARDGVKRTYVVVDDEGTKDGVRTYSLLPDPENP